MTRGLHSRTVAAARVALPVAALAMLSTLFLAARTVDPLDAVPFANVELSDRVRDRQLTAPRVMGETSGGTAFALRADAARPEGGDPRRLEVDAPALTLGLPSDRSVVSVAAARGRVDSAARRLVLEGRVAVDTTDGFRLRTERLEGDLATLSVTSPGPVEGEAPFDRLRAGAMTLSEDPEGSRRFVFVGGVDLVYVPTSTDP